MGGVVRLWGEVPHGSNDQRMIERHQWGHGKTVSLTKVELREMLSVRASKYGHASRERKKNLRKRDPVREGQSLCARK